MPHSIMWSFVGRRVALALATTSAVLPMKAVAAQARPTAGPVIGVAAPALPPPSNLVVKPIGDVLEIRYQAAPGAAAHNVSRRLPGRDWVNLPDVWSTGVYVDAGQHNVLPGQSVSYRVTAVFRSGPRATVAHSPHVEWTRPTPPVVDGLTGAYRVLDNGAKVVELSWNAAAGESFEIYRGGQSVKAVSTGSYFDFNVTSGTHSYQVARRVAVLTIPDDLSSRIFVIHPDDLSKQASVQVLVP